jgi:hypothetical protein
MNHSQFAMYFFDGMYWRQRVSSPYRPTFLGSCCFKGQNPSAAEQV